MKQVFQVTHKDLNLSSSDTKYYGVFSGSYAYQDSAGEYGPELIPLNGTLKNLLITLDAAITQGSYLVEVLVNGVATDLSLTIDSSDTYFRNSNTDISITAGDYVKLKITPSGTPNVIGISHSIEFTSLDPNKFFMTVGVVPLDYTAIDPKGFAPMGLVSYANITNIGWTVLPMPINFTLDEFHVNTTTSPTGTWTFLLAKNKRKSGGIVTGSTINDISSSKTYSTKTGLNASFVAGDTLNVQYEQTGASGNLAGVSAAVVCTSEVEGEYIIAFADGAQTANNRHLGILRDNIGGIATEAESYPTWGYSDITYTSFYADVFIEPGVGNAYTFTVRKNGVDTEIVASISGTNKQGSDTGSVLIEENDNLSIKVTHTGTPTNSTLMYSLGAIAGNEPGTATTGKFLNELERNWIERRLEGTVDTQTNTQDMKRMYYHMRTGLTGTLAELERAWLRLLITEQGQTPSTTNNISVLWRELMASCGYPVADTVAQNRWTFYKISEIA